MNPKKCEPYVYVSKACQKGFCKEVETQQIYMFLAKYNLSTVRWVIQTQQMHKIGNVQLQLNELRVVWNRFYW